MKQILLINIFLFIAFVMNSCTTETFDSNTTTVQENQKILEEDSIFTGVIVVESFSVNSNNENIIFQVKAYDKNNNPYNSGEIKILYPDKVQEGVDIGMFSNNIVSLENGIATFNYTAPNDLNNLVNNLDKNTTFGFYHTSNSNLIKYITVSYEPTSVNLNSDIYTILSDDNPLTITKNSETVDIKIKFFDEKNNPYNLGKAIVFTNVVKQNIGTFQSNSVDIINGVATFKYTAPKDISILKDEIINYQFYNSDNPSKLYSFNISFNNSINLSMQYSNMVISKPLEQLDVEIDIKDINGDNYTSGNIKIEYPSIKNSGLDVGKFSSNEVSISNGKANFTYIAPSNINDIINESDSLTFAFYHTDYPFVKTYLNIKYYSDIIELPKPEVILIKNNQVIDTNEQVLTLNLDIYEAGSNNLFETGSIKVEYPDEIKQYGSELGYFSSNSVDVVNGKATFLYTAPNNLTTLKDKQFTFNFYHIDNPSNKASLVLSFKPKVNQIVDTTYKLDFTNSDNEVTMPIDSTKIFTLTLKDEKGNLVEDKNIYNIKVKSLNSEILNFIKQSDGSLVNIIEDSNNSTNIILNSKTLSGLIPIEAIVNFLDINNNNQTISKVFNIVVLSGPPTTISFSYIETINDKSKAKFIENWIVRVSDKYLNPINTSSAVSAGAIVGFSNNGKNTNTTEDYLYYNTINGGTLNNNNTFTAKEDVFSNIDIANDVFVTFGNGYTYNSSGKWDFTYDTANRLILLDDYDGNTTSNIGFAMGNNHRQDQCKDGIEWTGKVRAQNDNYILSQEGYVILEVEYDYYLTGKDIVLWTNIVGDNKSTNQTVRIGEAQKVTLRGLGIATNTKSFGCGYQDTVRFFLDSEGTLSSYRNSNFIPIINTIGDVKAEYNSTSKYIISSCATGAYIDVDIDANVGECKGGSVAVSGKITSEF